MQYSVCCLLDIHTQPPPSFCDKGNTHVVGLEQVPGLASGAGKRPGIAGHVAVASDDDTLVLLGAGGDVVDWGGQTGGLQHDHGIVKEVCL